MQINTANEVIFPCCEWKLSKKKKKHRSKREYCQGYREIKLERERERKNWSLSSFKFKLKKFDN